MPRNEEDHSASACRATVARTNPSVLPSQSQLDDLGDHGVALAVEAALGAADQIEDALDSDRAASTETVRERVTTDNGDVSDGELERDCPSLRR